MPIRITLGKESFNSKSAAIRRCQEILHASSGGIEIVGDDALVVAAVLAMRSDKTAEIGGRSIERFLRQKHAFPTPCFYAELEDGTLLDFSFMKAIKAYPGTAAPRVPAAAGA
ncbi:DUF3223 domain-containing protein [Aurantimonas sp. E1-2-R+4]|uniref:DUF3223 domain-containing protein n=1 Tax=Aurantimonas sp. E1-2-R+4 TaxID=3113714 RepID=UPI002F92DC99